MKEGEMTEEVMFCGYCEEKRKKEKKEKERDETRRLRSYSGRNEEIIFDA